MPASRAPFVLSTTGTRPRSQTTSSTTTTAAIAAQQPVMATAPKPATARATPRTPRAAGVRDPQDGGPRGGDRGRGADPQHDRGPQQPRRVLAPDDHLAHQIV